MFYDFTKGPHQYRLAGWVAFANGERCARLIDEADEEHRVPANDLIRYRRKPVSAMLRHVADIIDRFDWFDLDVLHIDVNPSTGWGPAMMRVQVAGRDWPEIAESLQGCGSQRIPDAHTTRMSGTLEGVRFDAFIPREGV